MNTNFKFGDMASLLWAVEDMDRKYSRTPDLHNVLAQKKMLVFLPDDLKTRHRRFNLIRGHTEVKAHAAFTEKTFFHWKKELGKETFTIPLLCSPEEKKSTPPIGPMPARVCGELHLIDSHCILNLDQHRVNGVQFERVRMPLIVPYRNQIWLKDRGRAEEVLGRNLDASTAYITKWEYEKVWASMYVGKREYWDGQLDAGYMFQPVKVYKPNTNWIPAYSLYKDPI